MHMAHNVGISYELLINTVDNWKSYCALKSTLWQSTIRCLFITSQFLMVLWLFWNHTKVCTRPVCQH